MDDGKKTERKWNCDFCGKPIKTIGAGTMCSDEHGFSLDCWVDDPVEDEQPGLTRPTENRAFNGHIGCFPPQLILLAIYSSIQSMDDNLGTLDDFMRKMQR